MPQTIKITVPMAGFGTRLRPHTWSKPKPLLKVAGRAVLDHFLEQFDTVPDIFDIEYIFIVGTQGDQIKAYMDAKHPRKTVHYVTQKQMQGQSDALHQAREFLKGPMIMVFSDTLIEVDLAFLAGEKADGVAVVKRVPDPRRFGVVEVDDRGWVNRLIEKPQDISNNLALVGFYYFRSAEALVAAIEDQMRQGITLRGEYFLADAINILLEKGDRMRVEEIETWLDAGTPDALFDTNRYYLQHGFDNSEQAARPGVAIIPPVYIHESAQVESAVIGPDVSLGAACRVKDAVIRNTIIDDYTSIEGMILENTLIGKNVLIQGQVQNLNVGDNGWITR